MKTRKVQTKIWRDDWFCNLSRASRLLFIYLITNEHMGLSGYVEIPDRNICFNTGLNQTELNDSKNELKDKVAFYNGWVFVKNIIKHDPIKGDKNTLWKAYNSEIESIPEVIRDYLDGASMPHISPIDGGKGIGIGIGKGNRGIVKGEASESSEVTAAQEPIAKPRKPEYQEQLAALTPEVISHIADKYQVPEPFVISKLDDLENWIGERKSRARNRDLKRTLMAWVKKDALSIRSDQRKEKYANPVAVVPA